MKFIKVAQASEIAHGQTRFVYAERRPILLANWQGTIYALDGICPHQHRPLKGATLWNFVIDCPWHHFQYDVRTGENIFPRNVYPQSEERLRHQVRALRSYPVEIRQDEVWIGLAEKDEKKTMNDELV